jgi:hypothetical protein
LDRDGCLFVHVLANSVRAVEQRKGAACVGLGQRRRDAGPGRGGVVGAVRPRQIKVGMGVSPFSPPLSSIHVVEVELSSLFAN